MYCKSLCLLALLALSACALTGSGEDWPPGALPRDYFVDAYEADPINQASQELDNYLLWVGRFYQGMEPVPGWLAMTRQVLQRLEESPRRDVGNRLHELGGKIGAEWAKDNETRLISSRLVNVWRDALIEALNQDDLDNFLSRLEDDVDALLARELAGEEIYFERYYVDEFDF